MKTNAARLYRYVIKQRSMIWLGVLATLLTGLVELFTGSLLKFLTDLIETFDGSFVGEQAKNLKLPVKFHLNLPLFQEKIRIINKTLHGPDEVFRAMVGLSLLFLGLFALLALANYGRRVFMDIATQRILQDFKGDIYNKLLRLPYHFFANKKTGDLVSRITYDVSTLSEIIDLLIEVARALIFVLIFVPVMFAMSWQLSLFTLLFFPLSIFLIRYVTHYIRVVSKKITDNVGDYTAFLEEKINRMKLVKGFTTEAREQKTFSELISHNYRHNLRLIKLKYSMNPSNELLGMIALFVVYLFYSYRLTHGYASLGDIVFFIYLIRTVYKPVKKVAQAWGQMHIALISTRKIFNLLDEPEEEFPSGSEPVEGVETFRFESVAFQYPDGEAPVMEQVTFEVRRGDRIAIDGKSGAGKSTLLHLIPGFYPPTSGQILLNGKSYTGFARGAIRKAVSYLDTQSFFMNGSIRENIEYGGGSIPADKEAEYLQFLGLEKCSDFDLQLGNDGINLSEGQRQKVGFLRALLRKPNILILDEAFSSLDQEDIRYFMEQCKSIDLIFIVSRKPEVLQYTTKKFVLVEGCLTV